MWDILILNCSVRIELEDGIAGQGSSFDLHTITSQSFV